MFTSYIGFLEIHATSPQTEVFLASFSPGSSWPGMYTLRSRCVLAALMLRVGGSRAGWSHTAHLLRSARRPSPPSSARLAASVAASAAEDGSSKGGKGSAPAVEVTNFVRNIIKADLASGKHPEIVTRFPPEPNGYLHIGHAKSICVNFGLAEEFEGRTYMRFDDTNPAKEEVEYVNAIKEDVQWLGFDWGPRLTHASDYFDKFHSIAYELIGKGLAYVDELSAEEMREYRGTLTTPGKDSPHRTRPVEENRELFNQATFFILVSLSLVSLSHFSLSRPVCPICHTPSYLPIYLPGHLTGIICLLLDPPPLRRPPPQPCPPFRRSPVGWWPPVCPPPSPVPLRSWRPQPEIDQKHRGAIQREREEEREGARERYKGKMVVRHIWAERGKSV